MSKKLGWRAAIVAFLIIMALMYLTPSLTKELPPWWSSVLPQEKIHLGLDLQGGMHLILEVQVEKAIENDLERTVEELKTDLRESRIRWNDIQRDGISGLHAILMRPEDIKKVETIVKDRYKDFTLQEGPALEKGPSINLLLSSGAQEAISKNAVSQAVEKIRKRIDEKGLKEPDIRQKRASNEIIIQLPGVDETEYENIKKLIRQTALLEFKLVEDFNVDATRKDNIPPGFQILYDRETGRPMLLKKRTLMTGEAINKASVSFDQYGQPQISFSLNSRGAKDFERITGDNVGKLLAIVLDNQVYSAPQIKTKISGGRAEITGRFTMQEASDLAIVLKSGSLAAPVEITYENEVGPSLGKDSIEKGRNSMIIAGIIVVIFMIVYYAFSGIIADLALLLNILFIMGGLALFGATLTLPGIAGMILTIGMAVDANVLVFERIREELRLGKTPRAAIEGGYEKALVTILDANVTTFIAALILLQFGTGPIKGFAITLSIGIVASFVTAVFVTRIVFDYLFIIQRWKKISI